MQKKAYFVNGVLTSVEPHQGGNIFDNRGIASEPDTIIISDASVYDPNDWHTITDLEIPHFSSRFDAAVSLVS